MSLSAAPSEADEKAAQGREVMGKWSKAVITIEVTTKMRMVREGRETGEQEIKGEARAAVIRPDGLAVLSLSQVDPTNLLSSSGEGEEGLRWETEITDLKMRLASGKQVPAKIVLRDKDLDLAFARPAQKPDEPMPALDLTDSAKPEILDEIVILGRLGEVANRAPTVCLDRVRAIVDKPRTMYVPGLDSMMLGPGCPVFSLNGKVLGLLVVRTMSSGTGGTGLSSSSLSDTNTMPMILPVAEILEVAKQVAG
jgi:hypothetical protein